MPRSPVLMFPPAVAVLVLCLAVGLATSSLVTSATGCGSAAQEVKQEARAVWDCTSPELAPAVAVLAPAGVKLVLALLSHTTTSPDLGPFYAFLAGAETRVGACVLATAFKQQMVAPPPRAAALVGTLSDPVLQATFERLRVERWGGAAFLTVAGPI